MHVVLSVLAWVRTADTPPETSETRIKNDRGPGARLEIRVPAIGHENVSSGKLALMSQHPDLHQMSAAFTGVWIMSVA